MLSQDPVQGNKFDLLLDVMPRIAEVVNAFESEQAQCMALAAFLHLAGSPEESSPEGATLSVVPTFSANGDGHDARDAGAKPTPRAKKVTAKKSWTRVKDIDFYPEGKPSLKDFVAEKKPANHNERALVFVHYMEEYLGISSIEVGHVLAAYEENGWKSPAIPDNSLMVTASRTSWLDTSDMKAIKTTHRGRNHLQHDMPRKIESKSA